MAVSRVSNSVGVSRVIYIYTPCSFVRPVDPKKPGPVMCFGTIAAYDPESEMAQRLEGRFLIGTRYVYVLKRCFPHLSERYYNRFLEGLYTGFFIKDRTAEIMFGKLK